MSRLISTFLLVSLLAFLSGAIPSAPSLAAQEPQTPSADQAAAPDAEQSIALTLAEAEATLAAMESDSAMEDAVKALLRPKYKLVIETLKEAASFDAFAATYREAIDTGSEKADQLRAQLKALPSVDEAAKMTPKGDTEDLQQELDSQRAALSAERDALSKTTTELTNAKGRPVEISRRLPEAQRELAETRKQLDSVAASDGATSVGRVADRMVLQATESKLLSELEMLKQEQLSQSVREDLLEAQEDLLTRQVENDTAAFDALQALVNQRLSKEAQRVSSQIETTPQDLPPGDEAAQALLVEVQALAKEFERVVEDLKQVSLMQEDVTARRDRLKTEYESIRDQLSLGGAGGVMAQVLIDLRSRLRDSRAFAMSNVPLDETRLAAIEVGHKLRKQTEVESQFNERPAESVAQLLATRKDLLTKLRTQYGTLIRDWASVDGDKRQFLDQIDEIRAYISEELFWMKSSPPISIATLTDLPGGLRWVFSGEHWVELGRGLWQIPIRLPLQSIGMIVVLAAFLLRRRIIAALERTGTKIRRISTDRYRYTGEALLWTLLLAAPIPLSIAFTGWGLQYASEPSDWMEGIILGLQYTAWMTFVMAFLLEVCRRGGMGIVHFEWHSEPLQQFRRVLRRFAVVYFPAILVTCGSLYGNASTYFDSIGRISFILAHVWMAVFLWRLLHPSTGILAPFLQAHPDRLFARLRYVWWGLFVTFPIALVALAGVGYLITAMRVGYDLVATLALIAAGVILYELTLRWFMINERKLALAEALEKRQSRQAAVMQEKGSASGEEVPADLISDDELDLDAISEQTRQLLRLTFGFGLAATIVLLWSNNVPFVGVFQSTEVPMSGGLTLLGALEALLIVVATWLVNQNLPGLLELAVLRRTTIEPGTRTAISTLCQYGVVAVGAVLVSGVLNLDWAKFGWIAAALSVGLGFGLQEVVANFVCGLILLFERPIRVGDVVTLEGITGTVTRVQMRATTITNWDRQEFVVPNKNLITGTLLNWTLSASINRVVIPVGVAYGTDTEKARQILREVAAENPHILDDPAPMATFEAFADSSLTLQLFAFIPNLDRRLRTITELHTEIDKRFAAAGIEIAFPQLDLHLRKETEVHPASDGEQWAAR